MNKFVDNHQVPFESSMEYSRRYARVPMLHLDVKDY